MMVQKYPKICLILFRCSGVFKDKNNCLGKKWRVQKSRNHEIMSFGLSHKQIVILSYQNKPEYFPGTLKPMI